MLLYKTKGMTSPQGKRRVYFTCYTGDYERFFEQISTELLRIVDCAVWYSVNEFYEEIETDLGQMNLFVVPITAELLLNPCRAMDVDVPFAIKNHIPILPLMQEAGLDELFRSRFGDIQYLDPFLRDESAISYREKLKKYLDSILLDDDLTVKVRAEFEAYVFLSYRKKDRKYANELIKSIHEIDFCRDVAIWYDEYLIPGENFNETISDAIANSDAFVLVVTPNLVNEKNYVQMVEYPIAMRQGKPILPVLMERTDRASLVALYPNVPFCVDAGDGMALSNALGGVLVKVAEKAKKEDSQHIFYIGLAYLDGIDVEVNHNKALALIQRAAESSDDMLPDAIEKLVAMYTEGHGVKRDYQIAAEWQNKLTLYWEEKYKQTNDRDDLSKFSMALWDLCDRLWDLRDFDAAEQGNRRMVNLCNALLNEGMDDLVIQHNLIVSYGKLADIYKARNDQATAETFYYKSIVLCEKTIQKAGFVEDLWRDLSIGCGKLGDLYRAQNNIEKAESIYQKSLVISEALVKTIGSIEARRNLSIIYEKLEAIRESVGDLDGAEDYARKGLDLSKQLAEETEALWAWRDLAVSYERIGNLKMIQGERARAELYFQKSLKLNEMLVKEGGSFEAQSDLSIICGLLGDLCKSSGDLKSAESYFKKSQVICERLLTKISTNETQRTLLLSYQNLGEICILKKEWDEAEKYCIKSIDLCARFAKEIGSERALLDLSDAYDNMGNLCIARDDKNSAEHFYRDSLALRQQLAKEYGTRQTYDALGVSYYKLAVVNNDKSLIEKSFRIYNKLVQEYPSVTRYSEILGMIASILKHMN